MTQPYSWQIRDRMEYYQGGHIWYDSKTKEWVALSYVRNLGRYTDKNDARKAVETEAAKFVEAT